MRETHSLSDQAIGLASALGTKGKPGSHLHGRNSLAVRSGHRACVSTRHQEQAGEPLAWEKLTRCRMRPSGSRQHSAPRASRGAICMGETHSLSDQAIGLASALGTKGKPGSRLHGRNSRAVGSGHWARVSTRHQEQAGEPLHGRNSLAVGSGHQARVNYYCSWCKRPDITTKPTIFE